MEKTVQTGTDSAGNPEVAQVPSSGWARVVDRTCLHCGTTFKRPIGHSAMVHCSLACRLWARVDKSGGEDACWPHMGHRNRQDYGSLRMPGRKQTMAHRVAYTLTHGTIPSGLLVCHRCDNPPCCNPRHLFLGTVLDNVRDMISKGRAPDPSVLAEFARIQMTGSIQSPETRAKRSAALLGKKKSPEHIAALRASHLGATLTAEHKAKISASLNAYWAARSLGE